jgi:hypothetical protein
MMSRVSTVHQATGPNQVWRWDITWLSTMLAAVGPFAIERGLVRATSPQMVLRIYNRNTGKMVEAIRADARRAWQVRSGEQGHAR